MTVSILATPEPVALLARLRELLPDLCRRHPVASLAIFGSRARGAARPDSDLDLLVEWSGPASLLDYAALRADLEEHTGLRVELTNRRLIKPAMARTILGEAIAV